MTIESLHHSTVTQLAYDYRFVSGAGRKRVVVPPINLQNRAFLVQFKCISFSTHQNDEQKFAVLLR